MGALLYFSRFLAGFLDIDLIAYITSVRLRSGAWLTSHLE